MLDTTLDREEKGVLMSDYIMWPFDYSRKLTLDFTIRKSGSWKGISGLEETIKMMCLLDLYIVSVDPYLNS